MNRNVPHTRLTIDVNTTTSPIDTTAPADTDIIQLFPPLIQNAHFVIDVQPAGNTAAQVADFLRKTVPYTNLVFEVSSLTGGNNACGRLTGSTNSPDNIGTVTMKIGKDLVFAPQSAATTQPALDATCVVNANCEDDVVLTSGNRIIIDGADCGAGRCAQGCDARGRWYVAVGYPDISGLAGDWNRICFSVRVSFEPCDVYEFIPELVTINSANPIANAKIGNDRDTPLANQVPIQNNYFLLDFPDTTNTTVLYVALKGILNSNNRPIHGVISKGGLRLEGECADNSIVTECETTKSQCWCLMKIEACNYVYDASNPYFLNVEGDLLTDETTDQTILYTVHAWTESNTPTPVLSLPSTTESIFTTYVDTSFVRPLQYKHYVLNLPAATITELTWLHATLYVNKADPELVFFYNQNSLAGSNTAMSTQIGADDDGTETPQDTCYQAKYSCKTDHDGSIVDQPGAADATLNEYSACQLVFEFCELLPGPNQYFSVWGDDVHNSEPGLAVVDNGYDQNIHYTVKFTLVNEAYPLTQLVTENFELWSNAADPVVMTHQFVFNVPQVSSNFFIERVRVRIADVRNNQAGIALANTQAWIQCGLPVGPCPCYGLNADSLNSLAFNANTPLELDVPTCQCTSGQYYVSMSNTNEAYAMRPVSFTVTPYYDEIELVDDILTLPATLTGRLSSFNDQSYESSQYLPAYITDADLYRFRYDDDDGSSAENDNDELIVTVTWQNASPFVDEQMVVYLYVLKDFVPAYGLAANNNPCSAYACVANEANNDGSGRVYSYCTVIVPTCQFDYGDYYLRVGYEDDDANDDDDGSAVQYTLKVETRDSLPATALTIGTTLHATIKTSGPAGDRYHHYSFSAPAANSWLRASLYGNLDILASTSNTADEDFMNEMYLYYRQNDTAGDSPCFTHERTCVIGRIPRAAGLDYGRGYCDLFWRACQANQNGFLSVRANSHVFNNDALDYTLALESGGPTQLNLDDGFPVTGNLRVGQEDYYTFTIPANADSNKIMHVSLNCFSPEHGAVRQFVTELSTAAPEGSNDRCPCTQTVFVDDFETIDYGCDLINRGGVYFLTVRSNNYGINNQRPTSYTLRVWFDTINTQTVNPVALGNCASEKPPYLNLTNAFNIQRRIDYGEWVDFNIGSAPADRVLIVEVANIPEDTAATHPQQPGNANPANYQFWLNSNRPGSPANTLSVFGDLVTARAECAVTGGTCDFVRGTADVTADVPYCRFEIVPCQACGGNYHLTFRYNSDQPMPDLVDRASFEIRAYTMPVTQITTTNPAWPATSDAFAQNTEYTVIIPDESPQCFARCDEIANPPITTEQRFYYALPSTTVNVGAFDQVNLVDSSDGNIVNRAFATSFNNIPAGNDGPGGCGTAFPLSCTSSNLNFWAVAEATVCGTNQLADENLQFTLTYDTDKRYAAVGAAKTIVTNADPVPADDTLTAGQFQTYNYVVGNGITPTNIKSTITLNIRNFALAQTCVRINPTSTITNPVANADESYCGTPCAGGNGVAALTIDPCCQNTGITISVTAYAAQPAGADNVGQVFATSVANSIPDLADLSTSGTVLTLNAVLPADLYTWTKFSVTKTNFALDSIMSLRFYKNGGNGNDVTAYLQRASRAAAGGATLNCYNSATSCVTDAAGWCNGQLPRCWFDNKFGTAYTLSGDSDYYLAFRAAGVEIPASGFAIEANIYATVEMTGSPPSLPTQTVPDKLTGTVLRDSFMRHFKFVIPRTPGDVQLGAGLVAAGGIGPGRFVRFTLTPATDRANQLRMALTDQNYLAAPAGIDAIPAPNAGCPAYANHDAAWTCTTPDDAVQNPPVTVDGQATLRCDVPLCTAADTPNAYPTTKRPGQFFYGSVAPVDGGGAAQVSFSAAISIPDVVIDAVATRLVGVTPQRANDDVETAAATACTTSTTITGITNQNLGCSYATTADVKAVYYRVNIGSNFDMRNGQYLLVNVTQFDANVKILMWPADQCEQDPNAASSLDCTANDAGVDDDSRCFFATDPCTFTSSYQVVAGGSATPSIKWNRDYWVKVTSDNLANDVPNHRLVARVAQPLTVQADLTATVPTYKQTFVMWEERYVWFTFQLPNDNGDWKLQVDVTANCFVDTSDDWIWRNYWSYERGSPACSEVTTAADLTADGAPAAWSETIEACRLFGGEYNIAIKAPRNTIELPGYANNVPTPSGEPTILSPQVRFTITATVTRPNLITLPFDCTRTLPAMAAGTDLNIVMYGDFENFGTQASFTFSDCDQCELNVVSPLFKWNFDPLDNNNYEPWAPYNFAYRSGTYAGPQCTYYDDATVTNNGGDPVVTGGADEQTGLYYTEDAAGGNTNADSVIVIDPCAWRNGRFFLRLHANVAVTVPKITTAIQRRDVPVYELNALNNFNIAIKQKTIKITDDDDAFSYYQFFKVNVPEPENIQTLTYTLDNVVCTGTTDVTVWTKSGENGIALASGGDVPCRYPGDNCATFAEDLVCSDDPNGGGAPAGRFNTQTVTVNGAQNPLVGTPQGGCAVFPNYYFGLVARQMGAGECTTCTYDFSVSGRVAAPILLTPGDCYAGDFIQPGEVHYFKLDSSNINLQFARVTITAQVQRLRDENAAYNIELFYRNGRPASPTCNVGCGVDTDAVDEQPKAKGPTASIGPLNCGFAEEVYAAIQVDDGGQVNAFDGRTWYWIVIDVVDYSSNNSPVQNSAGRQAITTTGAGIAGFDNTAGSFALSYTASATSAATVFGADPSLVGPTDSDRTNCDANGCTTLTQCVYNGLSQRYNVRIDSAAEVTDACTLATSVPSRTTNLLLTAISSVPTTTQTVNHGDVRIYRHTFSDEEIQNNVDFHVGISNLQNGDVAVKFQAGGIPNPNDDNCPGTCAGAFSAEEDATGTYGANAGLDGSNDDNCLASCKTIYILVQATSTCGFDNSARQISYNIFIETIPYAPNGGAINQLAPSSGVVDLGTSGAWLEGSIARSGNAWTEQWFTLASGGDFALFEVGNVNNSNTDMSGLTMTIYKDGCPTGSTCTTGEQSDAGACPDATGQARGVGAASRSSNARDKSCKVYIPKPAVAGTANNYQVRVTASDGISDSASGLFFRIRGRTSFPSLGGGTVVSREIRGDARDQWEVDIRSGGIRTSPQQSQVLKLTVKSGPRLRVTWASSPDYITQRDADALFVGGATDQNSFFSQTKLCTFGDCYLDISTRAMHPNYAKLWVWVEPVPGCDGYSDAAAANVNTKREKSTFYDISVTQGRGNCDAFSTVAGTGFCTSILTDLNNPVYKQISAATRHESAQCFYESLGCKCNAKTTACDNSLKRFACLEFFRECDEDGFWTPICRAECDAVETNCDRFDTAPPTDADCCQSQYDCDSARYSDSEVCTGIIPPPPTPPAPPAPTPATPPTPAAPATPSVLIPAGPPGPTGPTGDDGPTGPTGPTGPGGNAEDDDYDNDDDENDDDDDDVASGILPSMLLTLLALLFSLRQ